MIKLIATDIDGTILIPEGDFTEGVKECFKKLNEKDIKDFWELVRYGNEKLNKLNEDA